MRRVFVIVQVVLESALRGLAASPLPSGIAVVTIAIALVLVGAFALLVGNMEGVLSRFASELHVVAYLDPSLSDDEQRALARTAGTIEGVAAVALVTRDEALARFRGTMGGSDLLAGLEDNPLPPSLELELTEAASSGEGVAVVAAALDGLPGVDELAHGQEWIEGYARAASLARSTATLLGAVLVGAALLIVANTIRLAVYAREDEIEILGLVGAGRTFVRAPFVIEGAVQGAVGGALALGVLWLAFRSFLPRLEFGLALFLGQSAPAFFAGNEALALVLTGAALGAAGSAVALVGGRR